MRKGKAVHDRKGGEIFCNGSWFIMLHLLKLKFTIARDLPCYIYLNQNLAMVWIIVIPYIQIFCLNENLRVTKELKSLVHLRIARKLQNVAFMELHCQKKHHFSHKMDVWTHYMNSWFLHNLDTNVFFLKVSSTILDLKALCLYLTWRKNSFPSTRVLPETDENEDKWNRLNTQ